MAERFDILGAALREEADLVRRLGENPLYRKLQAIQRVIAEYKAGSELNGAAGVSAGTQKPHIRHRERPSAVRRAKKNVIEETADAAELVVRALGRPVPRGELFDKLTAKGMVIKGKNPKNALATRLYHSGRFKTITGQGYVLKSAEVAKESETADGKTPTSDPSAASNRARSDRPGNPAPVWGQPNGGG